ncbi:zinc transport system substrate-binding protein [Nocardioides alpinus]|uniref:Zinc ABC transporter substrate-binding protein n=1 Tax=Nocardioides alpinus TaxID=748909 RepID=A0A1I0XWU2_9ACTN|nr:zinc ABC transporter substrate-binding protein [Nocardioides alpinus]PKH42838.1 zinc ABC transporter substrate-binding protein [Nocardioides alpinus]SFB04770.1 zinc transport system substrate-binding protein [Nocardioides alpinus]
MSLATRLLPLPSLLAATVLLAGCGQLGDDASGNGRRAVASFYPLAWVTERVAGDDWTVENLTQPGQEPHDLELTIAQTAALEDADLIVLEDGFQPAVDATVEGADAPVLDAAAVVDLLPATEDEHEGEEHEGETAEEHAEHGDFDPHFWLDPLLVADFADAVADELGEVDPDAAQTYADNAAALRTELESLDQDYTDGLASCERTTTVVSHQAFAYMARYGLDFEPIAGLSPDAEATAADLARLQELITEDGVTTVFSERLVSAKMAETLADDLGVSTAILDPIEGLSDDTTDEDYLSLMSENLTALQQANGCS